MKNSKSILVLVAIVLSFYRSTAQVSPANDPSWQLDPLNSDDFSYPNGPLPLLVNLPYNQATPNANRWHPHGYGESGQPFSYQSNVKVDNGSLKLIVTGNSTNPGPPPPNPFPAYNQQTWPYHNEMEWWYTSGTGIQACNWKTGGIYSNPWYLPGPGASTPLRYTFGYFEINAKLPGYQSSGVYASTNTVDSQGMSNGGLNPLWWFTGSADLSPCPNPNCSWEEVDVMEGVGWLNGDVRPNQINTHWYYADCNNDGVCETNTLVMKANEKTFWPMSGETDIDVVNQFHKYGFEWASDRMIFYFDDIPYYVNYNTPGIPQTPMAMYLSIVVNHPAARQLNPEGIMEPTAPLPANYDPNNTMRFEIDYFRYYKRKVSNCLVDYNILNNTDLMNFPPEVRQNVNVGLTGSEVVQMSPGNSKLIRHSSAFTAICDFEVPLGAELTVIRTPCQ